MKVQSTSEDVADFVRQNLPEFAEKRHAVMAKAMAEADKRPSASLLSSDELHTDVGFAATVVSQRQPEVGERVTRPDPKPAVTKPMPSARALLEGKVAADESVGGAFTDEEMAAIPKRRTGWFLVVIAAMAAGGYFAWPRGGARLRNFFAGQGTPTATAPVTSATTSASASASATAPASASVDVPASASASASALASASASGAPTATTTVPHPHSTDIGFTPGPPQPTVTATATATATAPPTATATATAPPTATATAPPTATANPPPEEQNPY